MQILDWNLRAALKHMKDAGPATWFVLSEMICRANGKGRCWPGTDLIASDTGYSVPAVVQARQWLEDNYAFVLVPYEKRTGAEIDLPVRLNIYQLTGILVIGEDVFPYLYMSSEARQDCVALLDGTPVQQKVARFFGDSEPLTELHEPDEPLTIEQVMDGTIPSIKEWVSAQPEPDWQELVDAERANKDRKTLIQWLESQGTIETTRDRIFDGLAHHLFNLPVGSNIGKNTAARIARIKSEVVAAYPDLTPEQLHNAVLWWKKNKIASDGTPLTLPRADAKVVAMLGEFFESRKHGANGAAYHSTVSERIDYVEVS